MKNPTLCPRLAEIQTAVCAHFNVSKEDLRSATRSRRIARPRQVAMHLARRMTVKSYTQIGQFFNRDHSTVMHAYEEIRRLRRVDPELNDGVRAVVEALK